MNSYIRFDWAMKRLLCKRDERRALEGLLSVVLKEPIQIVQYLEDGKRLEEEFDNPDRIDLLAENTAGDMLLIEVQNHNEYAYYERVIFGTTNRVARFVNGRYMLRA